MASQLRHHSRDTYVCGKRCSCLSGHTRKLTAVVVNACDPQNFEPNLALNLEIADLINAKKGNA